MCSIRLLLIKKLRGRQWVSYNVAFGQGGMPIPAQYFGKLPGFNLLKLTWLWGVFTLFVGYFLLRRHGNVK